MCWVGNWFLHKNQNPNRFRVLCIPFISCSPQLIFCQHSFGDIVANVTNVRQSSFKVRLNKNGSGQQLSIDNVFVSVILFTTFESVLESNIILYEAYCIPHDDLWVTVSCRESHNLLLGQMSDGSICSLGTFSVIFTIFLSDNSINHGLSIYSQIKIGLESFSSELKSEKMWSSSIFLNAGHVKNLVIRKSLH